MELPRNFRFSQNNLQDYLECPQRFLLRHVRRLVWPAEESRPVLEQEARLELGMRFHQLAQQAAAGVPADLLSSQVGGVEPLGEWWNHLNQSGVLRNGVRHWAEHALTAVWKGYSFFAVYDLVSAAEDGSFTIYDWKTAERRPRRDALERRVQTRLYRFLFCLAGSSLNNGRAVRADQVRMIYWFPNFPDAPEIFDYDLEKQAADGLFLEELIAEIASREEVEFYKTVDESRCRYCVYRSFCDRGLSAGDLTAADEPGEAEDPDFSLDFEQVAEIAF